MRDVKPGASEGPWYSQLIWSTGLVLVAAGAALTILMLAAVIGPFRFLVAEPPPPALLGLWLPAPGAPGGAARVEAWRRALGEARPHVASRSLEELVHAGAGAVVVPDARQLGPEELDALRAWIESGGGAVLVGSVAVREPSGAWRGYDVMRALLDVDTVLPLEAEASVVLAAGRRGPLSAALAPGATLRLLPEPGAPGVADGPPELRWPAAPAGADGASRRRLLGAGRLAWLAFGPEASPLRDGRAWDELAAVLHAALDWAARQPAVEVLPWRAGAAAAAVLEPVDGFRAPDRERRWRAALEAARAHGGMARLAIPADDPAARERARALALEAGAWPVTEAEWHAFARRRAAVQADVTPVGPRRLRLEVSNRGSDRVEGVALRLHLNRTVTSVGVRGTTLLQGEPRLRLPRAGQGWGRGDDWLDLLLPDLPPRSHRAWVVDVRTPAASPSWAAGRAKPPTARGKSGRYGREGPLRSGGTRP